MFGNLAEIHSAIWRDFIRRVGGIAVGLWHCRSRVRPPRLSRSSGRPPRPLARPQNKGACPLVPCPLVIVRLC